MGAFVSRHAVTIIAALAAAVTMLFVPPDPAYLGYFDFRTLACLLCLLGIVQAYRRIGFFNRLARVLIGKFRTLRDVVMALVILTLAASSFVTNDMALIMFLPLSALILLSSHNERAVPFVFTMQTLAANLGGMALPFGNPQNIFLNSRFAIPFPDFVSTMALPWTISTALIVACCLFFVKPVPIVLPRMREHDSGPLPKSRAVLYAALFAIALGMVFRVIDPLPATFVILAGLIASDRAVLSRIDYGLLLTFAFFFVFSGNMARIPAVQDFFTTLMQHNALLTSALASQVMSNVPAAILLAPFADEFAGLLVGVNIGGAGTLVASLASLIAFNQFRSVTHEFSHIPAVGNLRVSRYLLLFSALNFSFLAVLLATSTLFG